MSTPFKRASNADYGEDLDMALPALGDDDETGNGLDDQDALAVDPLPRIGDTSDPFDDKNATDLPLDIDLGSLDDEPSALDDDAKGIDDHDDSAVAIAEDGHSFVDSGGTAEEGLDFVGDDELGLDPIPREQDDGGAEGLEDPGGHMVDDDLFPPLDGEDDADDETIDVGIDLDLSAD